MTNKESSATASNSEGSSAGSSGSSASNETQTIYMPIKQSSNGKTAEAIIIKKDEDDKGVDVKDVKILEKN